MPPPMTVQDVFGIPREAFAPRRNEGEAGFGVQPIQRVFTGESTFSGGSMPQSLPDRLKLALDSELKYHLIYCYTEAVLSAAGIDFFLRGRIKLCKGNRCVGDLPAQIGLDDNNTLLKQSIVNSFVSAISVKYSIKVVFQNKFTSGAGSALLCPYFALATADTLTWSLEGHGAQAGTVDGYRTFVHVLSSNHPFP